MDENCPIYCINLEHRKDRKEHTIKEFEKLNIPLHKVIYPHFTKDSRGGLFGCFDSHMKIWNDFFVKYPKQKYCLIFEDDFVVSKKSKSIMKKAFEIIKENYKDIDLLFLHNIRVNVDNKINNKTFTNGYGLTTHSYFITRHYIQAIIKKHGKLPEPTGRHFDFELNQNIVSKDNWIYSENIFFTNKVCMKQLEESVSKSENYLNIVDKLFRQDIITQTKNCKIFGLFVKEYHIMNDDQLKMLSCFITKIII